MADHVIDNLGSKSELETILKQLLIEKGYIHE